MKRANGNGNGGIVLSEREKIQLITGRKQKKSKPVGKKVEKK